MWAQRKNLVFLTICVEDCVKPTLDIEATKLHFKGNGGADKKPYEVTIEFYKEIDTEVSIFIVAPSFQSHLLTLYLIAVVKNLRAGQEYRTLAPQEGGGTLLATIVEG